MDLTAEYCFRTYMIMCRQGRSYSKLYKIYKVICVFCWLILARETHSPSRAMRRCWVLWMVLVAHHLLIRVGQWTVTARGTAWGVELGRSKCLTSPSATETQTSSKTSWHTHNTRTQNKSTIINAKNHMMLQNQEQKVSKWISVVFII